MAEETHQPAKPEIAPENDKKFTVSDRGGIVRIMRGLAHSMDTVSAVYHSGHDIQLTAVVDVDADAGVVYLDTNVNKQNNDRLLASKRIIFVSNNDGVKNQWVSTEISMGAHEGHPAFVIPLPESVRYEQRRGFFRINTPMINPVMCKIPLGQGKEVEVALVDICGEGIGIVQPEPPIAEIERGAKFENCSIDFPEIGVVQVTLFVKSTWEVTLKNGNASRRAGLEFVDIRSGTQSRVQRYINKLQRERITSSKKN